MVPGLESSGDLPCKAHVQEDGGGFGGQKGQSSDPESAPSLALAGEPGVSSFILLSFPFLQGGKWQSLRKGRGLVCVLFI